MSPPTGSMRISKVSVRIEIRSSVLVVPAALGLLTAATVGVSDASLVITLRRAYWNIARQIIAGLSAILCVWYLWDFNAG